MTPVSDAGDPYIPALQATANFGGGKIIAERKSDIARSGTEDVLRKPTDVLCYIW